MQGLLAPFRGTALHYAAAYLDAVCLGAVRDMSDRQVFQHHLSEYRKSHICDTPTVWQERVWQYTAVTPHTFYAQVYCSHSHICDTPTHCA